MRELCPTKYNYVTHLSFSRKMSDVRLLSGALVYSKQNNSNQSDFCPAGHIFSLHAQIIRDTACILLSLTTIQWYLGRVTKHLIWTLLDLHLMKSSQFFYHIIQVRKITSNMLYLVSHFQICIPLLYAPGLLTSHYQNQHLQYYILQLVLHLGRPVQAQWQ